MKTAVLWVLVTCAAVRSEPTPPEKLDVRGADIFRALLKHHGLQPIPSPPSAEGVFVVFGQLPADHNQLKQIAEISRQYLARGGAVLIATDRKSDLTEFLPAFEGTMVINGDTVKDNGLGTCFQNVNDLPFLHFNRESGMTDPNLLAMSLLTRVATNRPSFIESSALAPPLQRLAGYSPFAFVENSRHKPRMAMGVARREHGQAVILADAGVLSNQMLAHPPTAEGAIDNYQFAIYLAAYLATGRDGQRRRCHFWENDRIRSDFDRVPLTPPVPDIRPSWPAIQKSIVENAEKKVNELQERDVPGGNLARDRNYPDIMQKLCAAAAIIAVLLLLRHVRGQRSDPEPPPRASVVKTENALADLSSVVRDRLRAQFATWEGPAEAKPKVAVQGSWLYRYRMRKLVQELASLAFAPPRRVSSGEWKAIDAAIAAIDDAVRQGRLTFVRTERTS